MNHVPHAATIVLLTALLAPAGAAELLALELERDHPAPGGVCPMVLTTLHTQELVAVLSLAGGAPGGGNLMGVDAQDGFSIQHAPFLDYAYFDFEGEDDQGFRYTVTGVTGRASCLLVVCNRPVEPPLPNLPPWLVFAPAPVDVDAGPFDGPFDPWEWLGEVGLPCDLVPRVGT